MTTFIPAIRRMPATDAARRAIRLLPLLGLFAGAWPGSSSAGAPTGSSAASTRPAARTVVDHAVQPAGGACQQCGPSGCRHGHHRDCRDGACVPYCPVRPGTFGFYGTQWRRWPGSGVTPVSHEQAATPVKPPKSAVPGADEESLGPKPSELPEPDFPRDRGGADVDTRSPPAPEPEMPRAAEPREPATEPREPAPEAAPLPGEESKPELKPTQPEQPAKPKAGDENLFDESAARKVRRKIPVSEGPLPAQRTAAGRVQPATHQEPAAGSARQPRTSVPRVAFDPRQESARLQSPVR